MISEGTVNRVGQISVPFLYRENIRDDGESHGGSYLRTTTKNLKYWCEPNCSWWDGRMIPGFYIGVSLSLHIARQALPTDNSDRHLLQDSPSQAQK